VQHRHRKIAVFFCDDDFFAVLPRKWHTSGLFEAKVARGVGAAAYEPYEQI